MVQDYLVRATAARGEVRAIATITTGLVETARQLHGTSPTATAALGRVLTAAVILGARLKDEQTVTVRLLGDGPVGGIVAVADAYGHVRGYAQNPQADLPSRPDHKLDVSGLVGQGFLYVTYDLGLKEPYTGSVPLVSGEVAEDLARYFVESEQTPAAVALGVLVGPDCRVISAGGLLVELMPGAPEELAGDLEEKLALMDPVSSLIVRGMAPEGILDLLFGAHGVKILETRSVSWQCTCTRERLEETLATLGEEEIRQMIEEDGGAVVHCRFCNRAYRFSRDDLERLTLR